MALNFDLLSRNDSRLTRGKSRLRTEKKRIYLGSFQQPLCWDRKTEVTLMAVVLQITLYFFKLLAPSQKFSLICIIDNLKSRRRWLRNRVLERRRASETAWRPEQVLQRSSSARAQNESRRGSTAMDVAVTELRDCGISS